VTGVQTCASDLAEAYDPWAAGEHPKYFAK